MRSRVPCLRTRRVASGCVNRSLSTASSSPDVQFAEAAFRRFGHLEARIDPLGLSVPAVRSELAAAVAQLAAENAGVAVRLRETFSGAIGAEFEHLESAEEREWFAAELARLVPAEGGFHLSTAQKRNAARLLLQADTFEGFLAKKYATLKRYSGEGTEALLPALDIIFAAAAAAGVKDIVIGQAHRGRLALLVSLLGYPARKLFHKIAGNDDFPAGVQGVDDVSSHIAASATKSYADEAGATHSARVTLLHNPSHLEAVNPVAVGKTRAKRDQGSPDALCVLIHGDAAVYGQGVVAETFAAAGLPGYEVGGTLHVVTNNQVGFTATEAASRSSRYASDVAKLVGAPVLHVNADAVREVALACRLAHAYRAAFRKDAVIDLVGYRRHGHNELDEPAFTQPRMYAAIRARPPLAHAYAAQLAAEGVLTSEARAALVQRLEAHLEAEHRAAATAFSAASGSMGAGTGAVGSGTHIVADGSAFGGNWSGMRQAAPAELLASPPTGADLALLRVVGRASVATPPGFAVHDRLVRGHVAPRLVALGYGADGTDAGAAPDAATIDWATAEALAFGATMAAGSDVRLSGQDAQRGTFSHRHAVLHDQRVVEGGSSSSSTVTPLNYALAAALAAVPGAAAAAPPVGRLHAVSSLLSEYGVLGFEYGYSCESPHPLVLWEAQFGDFANTAQVILDQFVSGGESKWLRQSGLVLLLPHGYDGAGPEHSSARIERLLQLVNSQAVARGAACLDPASSGDDKSLREAANLIVVQPTTPANYFHALRRQLARPFRKPLAVVAPKTLLRHPAALSALAEMGPGTAFQPVLTEGTAHAPHTRRVLLCSGKIYLDLLQARRSSGGGGSGSSDGDTAIVRIEELSPFPTQAVAAALRDLYPGVARVDWVQEEPANAGAWTWAEAHMTPALAELGLPPMRYIGRPALAAPAVGLSKLNKAQHEHLLRAAFPPLAALR